MDVLKSNLADRRNKTGEEAHYSSGVSVMGIFQPYSLKSEVSRIDAVCVSVTVDNLQCWCNHSKSYRLGKTHQWIDRHVYYSQ